MRKRLLAAVLALLLLLCGCSSGSSRTPVAYDLSIADILLESGAFEGSEMAPLDMDILAILYGIDRTTITDGIYYMAANTSASADELVVLILADEQAATAAEEACKARVASQITVCEDYCPAAVPRLENAVISRIGSTLLFAVGDPDTLSKTLK